MSRFSRYHLQSTLCLDDGLCRYLIQDRLWSHCEILDVPVVAFDHEQDAEQMLQACIEYNAFYVLDQLRSFLAEECHGYHFIFHMADQEVIRAAACELTSRAYRIVIEPGPGWAVRMNETADQATLPVAVEPEPEISPALAELKAFLDGMVAEQRKKYHEWEAKLADLSDAEQAALYGKQAGGGIYNSIFGSVVSLVKALPGMVKGSLQTMYSIAMYPSKLGAVTAEAIATGSLGPLEAELDKVVKPLVHSYEEVIRYKGVLLVLYNDEQTMSVLQEFGRRYYDATHPLELTEMGAENATDIVVTILLAIPSGGAGGAANLAAKAPKLAKVVELLERLARMLKRVGRRSKLPKKRIGGGVVAGVEKKSVETTQHGMSHVKKPKVAKKVDKTSKKVDDFDGEGAGPKKTPPKSACELYDEIRRSKTDANDIAKNYNLKPERLQKIKDYVFNNPKFNRNDKSTAEAWLRLAEGRGSAHDKFLLKHETVEMFYNDMKKVKPGLYDDKFGELSTHDVANYTGYDWEQGFIKRGPRQEM